MKLAGFIFATVAGVGLLAIAAPCSFSQAPASGITLLSTSEPVTYKPATEAVPVRAALDRFDYALAMHDVGMLQAAGVKRTSAKRWERFFRDNPRATVTDQCPSADLFISDDTASWTCLETATIISEGKPRSFLHIIHFTFVRNNGMWMVADRQ